MAGKKNTKKAGGMRKHIVPDREKTAAEYYELHTGAVNDLVEADESNSPEVSPQELAKYRSGGKIHIPETAQVLFLKAWFAGAVCFFFFWGLGMYVPNLIDMLFIVGLVMGFVTDLMVNVILRYFEKTPPFIDIKLPQLGTMTAKRLLDRIHSFNKLPRTDIVIAPELTFIDKK